VNTQPSKLVAMLEQQEREEQAELERDRKEEEAKATRVYKSYMDGMCRGCAKPVNGNSPYCAKCRSNPIKCEACGINPKGWHGNPNSKKTGLCSPCHKQREASCTCQPSKGGVHRRGCPLAVPLTPEQEARLKAAKEWNEQSCAETLKRKEAAVFGGLEPEPESIGLQYPELGFPRDAVLVAGSNLEKMVSHASKGGDGKPDVLDPGLMTEAMLTLASGLPYEDEMLGIRVNRYSVLLAVSRGGKGMTWRRAAETLGLKEESDYNYYDPSGHVQMIHQLGDRYEGKKPNQTHTPGPRKMTWISEELSGALKMASSEGSKIMQQLLQFYDRNIFNHHDSKTGKDCRMDCRLSWGACLAVGYGKIEERKFSDAFTDASNDGLIGRMSFGFSEQTVDPRDLEGWQPPDIEVTSAEIEGMGVVESYGDKPGQRIAGVTVKGYDPSVFEAYRACDLRADLAFPGWQFALKKNMVHIALVNLHENITTEDFNAALAYTKWQGAIRKVFAASQADDDSQARFNEKVIRALRKEDQAQAKKGKKPAERVVYVPRVADRYEWATKAKRLPIDRTILELANMGVLVVDEIQDAEGKTVERDWKHVRVVHHRADCWCGKSHSMSGAADKNPTQAGLNPDTEA
jgi:hypothetical protein